MEEKREIIYSDISSASRKQPYDAMVYLEGTKVIAVDSTGRKIATGTAGTDDATVIQAALDEQGTIYIGNGTYYLSGEQTLRVSSDTHVTGDLQTKINSYRYGFHLDGAKTETVTTVTADVGAVASEIPVDDASPFSVGDYILINSNRRSEYLNAQYGEIRRIDAISESVLTTDPVEYHYALVDSPVVTKLDMVSNVTIENIEIYSESNPSTYGYGILCEFARSVIIRNIHAHHFGYAQVYIASSIDVVVEGCDLHHGTGVVGVGYGIAIGNASRNIVVNNNSIYENRNHATTICGNYQDGYPTHIYYTGNYISGDEYPIDSHYGGVVVYKTNIITSRHHGALVGANTVTFDGCVFNTMSASAIKPRSETSMLRHLNVTNCQFINIGGLGIDFTNLLTFETLSVSGCTFDNTLTGIMLRNIGKQEYSSHMDFESVKIVNNTFTNCSTNAIDIRSTSEYTIRTVQITDNLIRSTGTSGIHSQYNDVIKISGNVVYGTGGSVPTPDASAIGCVNGNIVTISDNAIRDFGRRGITIGNVGTAVVAGNVITGSAAYTSGDTYGISVSTTVTSGSIINNVVTGTTGVDYNLHIVDTTGLTVSNNHFQPGLPSSGIVDNTYFGNVGYVTENSGAAATVADGGTIAHGCAAAPTKVTLTGSVAGEIVTVTSIDATNITVAIKKPDNSAGTTQTIYWRAEV